MNYSKSELKLKKLEKEAKFWKHIDESLPNFPLRQHEITRYGDTDSILSRSLTAKEIYNSMYQPNQHLPHSLKCKICQQPLTALHPCLYQGQPTPQNKAKVAELYYNWERFHSTSLKDAVTGTTLQKIARMMNTVEDPRETTPEQAEASLTS